MWQGKTRVGGVKRWRLERIYDWVKGQWEEKKKKIAWTVELD